MLRDFAKIISYSLCFKIYEQLFCGCFQIINIILNILNFNFFKIINNRYKYNCYAEFIYIQK